MAALEAGACPWQVSFKGTLQTLNSFLPLLAGGMRIDDWCQALFTAISVHFVANRPDRYEPRRVKRRLKKYPYFREPRANYRRRMAQGR